MPGTWPQVPKPAAITVRSISQNVQSVTHSLRRIVRSRGAHRWGLDVVYPPMHRDQAEPIFAFAAYQLGSYGTFEFVLPVMGAPRGVVGRNPRVDGAGQIGQQLRMRNLNPNAKVFAAGDYFRLSDAQKVYKVLRNVRSTPTGTATVAIAPALQSSPQNNAAVITTGLTFRCAMTSDIVEVAVSIPLFYQLSVQLIEVPT